MLDSSEIIIREYRDGDEWQINQLHNNEYGTSRTLEQWEWEFKNGPYGRAVLVVAECNGDIIGTQALLPTVLSWKGREILSAKAEEVLVKEQFRGRGIFRKLYESSLGLAVQKKIAFVWGFSQEVNAYTHIGFYIPGRMNYAILVLDPSHAYHSNKSSIPANLRRYSILHPALMLSLRVFSLCGFLWFRMKAHRTVLPSGYHIESITQADAMLDTFWQLYAQKENICTIARTARYLDWRFFRNPYMESKLIALIRINQIVGYSVVSRQQDKGILSDFCVLDEIPDRISGLLMNTAIENLRRQGASFIYGLYVNSDNTATKKYVSCLERAGFISLPVRGPMVMKLLSDERDSPINAIDLNQWYITTLFREGVE